MTKEAEERDWLVGELATNATAWAPTINERVKATKSFVGSQVGPTTGLTRNPSELTLFTTIPSIARENAYRMAPTLSEPRVIGTTFRYEKNMPIPEWDTEQGHEGIRIPGEISNTPDFMRQAELALHAYHSRTINELVQRGVPLSQINLTKARFDRNMARFKQGHLPTIANALGLMGHPVAIDSKKSRLAIAQFHPITNLMYRDTRDELWKEQPVPSGRNRITGGWSSEEGSGPILGNGDRRPRWSR